MIGAEIHLGSGITATEAHPQNFAFHPLDETPFQLSYYGPALDCYEWIGGGFDGAYVMVSWGERFTLPGNSGFVDSVMLQIDSITAGTIYVVLLPDTLIDIGRNGIYFHLMDIRGILRLSDFDCTGYAVQTIQSNNVHSGVPTTVHFPHVAVPQSFFVEVVPDVTTGRVMNAFSWRGDMEAPRARTPDNCRSGYVAENLQNQGVVRGISDSTFEKTQGNFIFSNLYATLYGSSGSSGVPIQLNSDREVALYPNPATTILNIPASMQASDFELRDILGRTVLHSSERNPEHVDVHSLASGDYLAFIHTPGGIITTPVMIAR